MKVLILMGNGKHNKTVRNMCIALGIMNPAVISGSNDLKKSSFINTGEHILILNPSRMIKRMNKIVPPTIASRPNFSFSSYRREKNPKITAMMGHPNKRKKIKRGAFLYKTASKKFHNPIKKKTRKIQQTIVGTRRIEPIKPNAVLFWFRFVIFYLPNKF